MKQIISTLGPIIKGLKQGRNAPLLTPQVEWGYIKTVKYLEMETSKNKKILGKAIADLENHKLWLAQSVKDYWNTKDKNLKKSYDLEISYHSRRIDEARAIYDSVDKLYDQQIKNLMNYKEILRTGKIKETAIQKGLKAGLTATGFLDSKKEECTEVQVRAHTREGYGVRAHVRGCPER